MLKSPAPLIAVAALSCVAVGQLQAGSPVLPGTGARALVQRLDTAVQRGEVPAVVVLVTSASGVLFEHAAGMRSAAAHAPLHADAIFRIASMTKPVTSAAIMMLVEAGRIRLEDPAGRYVPSIDAMKVVMHVNTDGSLELRPPRRAITIHDLLAHTSGIGYSRFDPLLWKVQQSGKTEPELPLLHDPGVKWTYGASTRYLGDVIEQVSGQPLDVFLRTRVLDPLAMGDTSYDVSAERRARLVTVHQRSDGKLIERPNPEGPRNPVRGDGGLFSTARDYAKFLRMFLNGGRVGSKRILSERSIRDMTRNQIGQLLVTRQPSTDVAFSKPFPMGAATDYWGFGDTWGLGFQIASLGPVPNRRRPGSYGWAGINNTYFWVDPQRQIGVVVLMQLLPFYDDAGINLLVDVEELVNRHLE